MYVLIWDAHTRVGLYYVPYAYGIAHAYAYGTPVPYAYGPTYAYGAEHIQQRKMLHDSYKTTPVAWVTSWFAPLLNECRNHNSSKCPHQNSQCVQPSWFQGYLLYKAEKPSVCLSVCLDRPVDISAVSASIETGLARNES